MQTPEDTTIRPATPVVRTLVVSDLVDSTRLVERLGDLRASDVFTQQDRLARDLLVAHGGLEIDKTDGFLLLFDRPIDAVKYALEYHTALRTLSDALDVPLRARVGIHLGEVVLHENPPGDVARGAKPIEVEGIAKPLAARLMSLAQGGQTLLTRSVFDIARRSVVGTKALTEEMSWMAHGPYLVKGSEDPIEVFEVGVEGVAPLVAPPDSEKARRAVTAGDEKTLGWRPATGQPIPRRSGWVLDHKLGEGGFGEVWLAIHQRTKDRRVFKFCFDADRLRSLQRELTLFRLLRETLGDRKDIARLYEVQLEEAPFYLESEFSPAGSLTEWAEAQGGIDQVPLETRVDLVAEAARAVAAAHSVGVLHKDIKPGNILVYEDETGRPHPRLADFGIGTLADPSQLQNPNITVAGFTGGLTTDLSSRTGTRMYAPPESLAGEAYTVLGDVYALGVVLYQMVVGDLERPLAQGWEQDVPGLLLREDIAACVEGHQEQRLGSAQGLAKLLESLPERRRQRRRRQGARLAVVASVPLLVLLTIATVWGLREGALRERAEIETDKTKELNDFLENMMSSPDPWDAAGADVLVVDVLDRAAADLENHFAGRQEVRASLHRTLGRTYRQLSQYEKARPHLDKALALGRELLAAPHEDLARSLHERAALHYRLGEFAAADPLYREALTMRRQLVEKARDRTAALLDVAESATHLTLNEMRRGGDVVEAERLAREALAIRQQWLPPEHRDVARSLNNLAVVIRRGGNDAEAESLFRQALPLFENLHEGPHPEIAGCLGNLARCVRARGDNAEAQRLLEAAVAIKRAVFRGADPSLALSLYDLGDLLLAEGKAAEAEPLLREAVEMRRRLWPAGHIQIAESESVLARSLTEQERYADAELLLRSAYDTMRSTLGNDHAATQSVLERLIAVYRKLDREDDAKRYERRQGG